MKGASDAFRELRGRDMLNFTCTSNADKQLLPLIRLRVPPEVPILAQPAQRSELKLA